MFHLSSLYRWFTHFYLWGVLWNWSLLWYYSSHCFLHMRLPLLDPIVETVIGKFVILRCGHFSQAQFEVWLVLFLLCLQVSRRLYECVCESVFSDNKMGLVHYIIGFYFYSSVGLVALLHLDSGLLGYWPTDFIHCAQIVVCVYSFASGQKA